MNPQTSHCVKCFKKIEQNNFIFLAKHEYFLCNSCLKEKITHFQRFKVNGVKAYSIYDYNEYIQDNLFKFKGCGDYELRKLFLHPFEREMRWFFKGYSIVCAPSYYLDDEVRGFNHVEEIFKRLNLPIIKVLEKTKDIKQVDVSAEERKNIKRYLKVNNIEQIFNKKILLVDDVITTGSTLKAAIELLKLGKPKSIKILVIAKTINSKQN